MITPLRRGHRTTVTLLVAAWLAMVLGGCGPQVASGPASPGPATTSATSAPSGASPTAAPAISADPGASHDSSPTFTDAPRLPTTDPESGLPFIDPADLPPEALGTLALIAADGPFPFDRDGLTFQNREELLPDRPSGYYREFTVITPGLPHRGALRIVAGVGGERYYTTDHYESFGRIRLSETVP